MQKWISIALIVILASVLVWLVIGNRKPSNLPPEVTKELLSRGEKMKQSEEALGRGINFLRSGDPDKALFELGEALRIDSLNYRAYYNLGILYRYTGNPTLSMAAYRTCLQIGPIFMAAENNIANLFLKESMADSALAHINRATAMYPDCTDFIDTRIDALIAKGETTLAKSEWQKAFKKDPNHLGLKNKESLYR